MDIGIKTGKSPFPGKGQVLIYFVFEEEWKKDQGLKILDELSAGFIGKKIVNQHFDAKAGKIVVVDINKPEYDQVILVGAGKKDEFSLARFKNLLAETVRTSGKLGLDELSLFYFPALGDDHFNIGKNLSLAFHLANYRFDKYKSKKNRRPDRVTKLVFLKDDKITSSLLGGISFGELVSQGISLTRDLVNEPASHLHPVTLESVAFQIEKTSSERIKVEVLDKEECVRLGMGAFLGVAQGSEREAKFIVLKYLGPKAKKTVSLIGKTIIFDSGGLSLKPSSAMETMKCDMAGGATVLGIFKILSKIPDLPLNVYGLLPVCENMPSGGAIRPGDVLTAVNGKTIEVLNTDAEGRLTLADALSYSEKYLKSDLSIDLATLTGACIVALGKEISGLMGNDKKTMDLYQKIADKEGDLVWPLPMHKDYLEKMKQGSIADIKNVSGSSSGGGAITAALFLSEFVDRMKWLHIDIAGPAFWTDRDKGVISHGGTGWGVVSIIELLKNLS